MGALDSLLASLDTLPKASESYRLVITNAASTNTIYGVTKVVVSQGVLEIWYDESIPNPSPITLAELKDVVCSSPEIAEYFVCPHNRKVEIEGDEWQLRQNPSVGVLLNEAAEMVAFSVGDQAA